MDRYKISIIVDFINFCKDSLQLNEDPSIYFTEDRDWVLQRRSFGEYNTSKRSVTVYVKNRNTADIIRTLAHEMIHHKQQELGRIQRGSGKAGSDIENEANSLAGVLLREYGKMNELIYEMKKISSKAENETFSAYHGRYLFDVTKAYDLIAKGEIKSQEKLYNKDLLYHFSHPEFSHADPKKVAKMKIDYENPIGILVKFEDPESKKTEWILIDGNHRVRKATEEDREAKLYVVSDPKDVKKFLKVNRSKPHRLFIDDED